MEATETEKESKINAKSVHAPTAINYTENYYDLGFKDLGVKQIEKNENINNRINGSNKITANKILNKNEAAPEFCSGI